MYKRTIRWGPGVALQMMRCDEARWEVLQETMDADSDYNDGRGAKSGRDGVDDNQDPPASGKMAIAFPHRSGRGKKFALGELTGLAGLVGLCDALGTSDDDRLQDAEYYRKVRVKRTVHVQVREGGDVV